jgi:FeS assembly SUF system regulator
MLRIGKLTDYAIVVLAHMARNAHRCVHPATDLSEQTAVPLPTVQKVLKSLLREGLVVSMRGARGGYALAEDPAVTTLVRILEAMEGPLAMTDCAVSHNPAFPNPSLPTASGSATHTCHESSTCAMSGHWPLISNTVREALRHVTLLDLSKTRTPIPGPKPTPRAAPEAPLDSPRATAPLPHGVRT